MQTAKASRKQSSLSVLNFIPAGPIFNPDTAPSLSLPGGSSLPSKAPGLPVSKVGNMETEPRHCPGDPCSHYWLCEQGFWDIDPKAMSG